jgi:hypothetical protein
MYGEERDAYRVSRGRLMETDHLKEQDVRGRIILKRILAKHNGEERGMDLPGSGQEQIAGSREHSNELHVLQKAGGFNN